MSKSTAFLASLRTLDGAVARVAAIRAEYPDGVVLARQDVVALQSIATRPDASFSEKRVIASRIKHGEASPALFVADASAWGLCSERRVTLRGDSVCGGDEPDATQGDAFGARRKVSSVAAIPSPDGWTPDSKRLERYAGAIEDGTLELVEKVGARGTIVKFTFQYFARQNACKVCRSLPRDGSYPHAWEA